jgi:hypothetical protein
MWAGQTTTRLPVSRRKPDGKGGVEFRPWPAGTVCDCLPLCLFKDTDGAPVSLLYSVSCHPSTVGISEVSADYPGVATRLLNAQLGVSEGALFLQGCGGDSKPVTIADGHDAAGAIWRSGTWEDVDGAGRIVAEDAAPVLADGLEEVEPCLRTHAVTVGLPLESPKERQWYEKLAAHPETWPGDQVLIRLWAERQVEMLRGGERQQAQVDIAVQGIQLGKGVRMIGLEGEAVGELGRQALDFYGGGVTFPLGYIDATLIYLPTTAQIPEGGYEVDSYYEYGFPTPLAEALDSRLGATLDEIRDAGIE